MKYLQGVLFDRSLAFHYHVEMITAKVGKGLAAKKATTGLSDSDQRLLIQMFYGLVLSVIQYTLGDPA